VTHKAPGQELVFFVDQFGVPRIFDGTTTVQVGYSISKSPDTTVKCLDDMDKTRLAFSWALNYPERSQILCFMTSKSGNIRHDVCWVLDYSKGFAWGRFKFADFFSCGTLFEKPNGTFRPFFGDYSGTVYEYDNGTNDNGDAIDGYAEHGDIFSGDPSIRSNYKYIELRGTTGTTSQLITTKLYVDGSTVADKTLTTALSNTATTWGEFEWGTDLWGKAGRVTKQQEINMDAKALRVRNGNSTLNNVWSIEGFSVYSLPEGSSQV
jgi:hypothetical protein